MRRLLIGLAVLLAAPAFGQTYLKATSSGAYALTSAQGTTGASTSALNTGPGGYASLIVEYTTSAGTADVKLQLCCANNATSTGCTADGRWIDVANSSKTVTAAGTATDAVGLDNPQCAYRSNVTACTGCSVSTNAYLGGKIR